MFEKIDKLFPWQLFVDLTSLSSGILRRSDILKLLSQQSLCKYVSSGHETTRSLCLFFSAIPAPGHFRRRITSVSSTVVRDRARGLASLTPQSAGSLSEFDWCFSNMSFFRTSRSIPFFILLANLLILSVYVTVSSCHNYTTVVYFSWEHLCRVPAQINWAIRRYLCFYAGCRRSQIFVIHHLISISPQKNNCWSNELWVAQWPS